MTVRIKTTKQHVCNLPAKDTTGLPKLPPNANRFKKNFWRLRKLFLLNPNNYKCKKLFRNKGSMITERKRHASGPNSLVFHPLSLMSSYIGALFYFSWFYCLICDPLMVYSNGHSWIFKFMQSKVIFTCQIIVIMYFFNAGYIDSKTKLCIVDQKKIILKYLRTYFLFDISSTYFPLFLATTLTDLGFFRCSVQYAGDNNCYGYLYLFRLLCCGVRIHDLFETIEDTFGNMGIQHRARLLLIHLTKTFIYLHFFAFLLYFVPYMKYKGDWPAESWLSQAKIRHIETFHHQYSECFITSVCHFFAINYRYNVTLLDEHICIAIITFFGRLYTLYLLADILTVFGIAGVSESMYERQLVSLHRYMADKDLPESLRQRVIRYYKFKFQKRYFREGIILSSLSEHLRTELFLYTARKLVQKVEFFKKLPNTTLGAIIAAMKSEIFSSSDIIVKIGSEIEDIYFISTGTVAVTNSDGVELCHLEDGAEFGSTCVILREQLFAMVAVETTEVFYINKDMFLEFLSPHKDVTTDFHRSIKQKLDRYKALEDDVTQINRNVIDDLPNIMEQRTRRLIVH